jgi:D-alanyl-D-alanine carboxypeptidase (penicillin-binding protein 5/6)
MSPCIATAAMVGCVRRARALVVAVLAILLPLVLPVVVPSLGGPAAALATTALATTALATTATAPPGGAGVPAPAAAPVAAIAPSAQAVAPSDLAVGAGATGLPARLTAGSWLVADAESGQILAAKGADFRDLPASTMKILTALVVLPGLAPDVAVTVGQDAAHIDGTKVGLVPGQRYSVRDLATAMLIASGNDATVALVDAAGGSAAVVTRMNALAAALGATDTHAVDPTGLDAPGQLTSVRDLAILGRAALAEPAVNRYLTIPRAVLPTPDGGSFEIQNHNLLLGRYPGTLGVKNGYTVAADATYVGAARRGGRTMLVALLRAAPDDGVDARALLDWGFANDGLARAVGALPAPPVAESPAADGTHDGEEGISPPGHHHAPGPGLITWIALGVTVLAGALTAVTRRRQQILARRRARRFPPPPLTKPGDRIPTQPRHRSDLRRR